MLTTSYAWLKLDDLCETWFHGQLTVKHSITIQTLTHAIAVQQYFTSVNQAFVICVCHTKKLCLTLNVNTCSVWHSDSLIINIVWALGAKQAFSQLINQPMFLRTLCSQLKQGYWSWWEIDGLLGLISMLHGQDKTAQWDTRVEAKVLPRHIASKISSLRLGLS